jgi:hypothetical protein
MNRNAIMRGGVWLGILIVAGGVVFGLVQAYRSIPTQSFLLPDGSRFTLLGVTMANEKFSTDKPWHKPLRRWLPARWLNWLPASSTSSSGISSTNAATIWFTLTDSAGADVNVFPWHWYGAVGDDGFEHSLGGGSGASSAGGRMIRHLDLEAFPRRQKDFDFRLLDQNRRVIGSIRLHNPARGPFPEWSPAAMPVTQTNGPVVVTLESITERTNRYGVWLAPKWKLVATDSQWRQARPVHQVFEDATGNRGGRLSFQETAWKLTMPFRRVGWTNYSEDERIRLVGLSVPEPGTMQLLQTNFTRLGVNISVQALVGAGTLSITNGTNYGMPPLSPRTGVSSTHDGVTHIQSYSSLKPFFLIEASQPAALDELQFRVIGADGNALPLENSGWYGSPGGGRRYMQKFDVTNDVRQVNLEVIVSRAKLFEFIVNPAEVQRLSNTNL